MRTENNCRRYATPFSRKEPRAVNYTKPQVLKL